MLAYKYTHTMVGMTKLLLALVELSLASNVKQFEVLQITVYVFV